MEAFSRRLAKKLVENTGADERYIEWYRYKIEIRLGQILTYGSMLLIAALSRHILEGALFLLFLLPLRKIAGGYHANKHISCYIASILCFCAGVYALPLLQNKFAYTNYIFMLFAGIIVLLFAPVIHPNLPQKNGHKQKMRFFSLAVLSMQAALVLLAMVFNFPAQLINVSVNGMLIAGMLLLLAKITKQEGAVNVA